MPLTPKQLRIKSLVEKHRLQDLTSNLQEHHHLADTLIYLQQVLSEKNIQIPTWMKDSETLLHKFIFHSLTLNSIHQGLEIGSTYYQQLSKAKITDVSSGKAVLRCQLETFLIFHHIYVNSPNDDEKRLRYLAWIYSSILDRRTMSTTTDFAKSQRKKDEVALDEYRTNILALPTFKQLSLKQQNALLQNGSGKLFKHWSTILIETGFGEDHIFYKLYNYLSVYAHSEGISAIQLVGNVFNYEMNKMQSNLDVNNSKFLLCLMIKSWIDLFPDSKDRFGALTEDLKIDIDFYCEIAKRTPRTIG